MISKGVAIKGKSARPEAISERFIATVCRRLSKNKRVRRMLPMWGRLHIDRQLPFLCVYRRPSGEAVSKTERLVMGEASYLTASSSSRLQQQLCGLIRAIATTLKENFGSFLIVEVWVAAEEEHHNQSPPYKPAFKIVTPKKTAISSTIETFERTLKEIKIRKEAAEVKIVAAARIAPSGSPPLLSAGEAKQLGCHIIGIELRPIYRDVKTGQEFPLIRRELHRGFARTLRRGFFEFTRTQTTHRPPNYQALGRHAVVKAVWQVDQQLAEISNGFDFLLQVTPMNPTAAWSEFKKKCFESIPEFLYRPLPIDPALAKRQLFRIPIERIEDPTLAQLFREQQLELERQLTMLIDRDTPRFKYGSLQLFGAVDESLLKLAKEILEKLPPHTRNNSAGGSIDAARFAARASEEIEYFRASYPEIRSRAIVSKEISGLMVSRGNLLIGKGTKIPLPRIEALIQHEVGTHILTYYNGRSQPFKQLYVGLAGYEELQEGLAVLSEYLVGGLTRPRLRLLAARVLAARLMIDGASFVEVYRELQRVHDFAQRTAFAITMRIFRGGGLTKDIIYLRGLVQLLNYLKNGGEFELLFVGKIAADHVAIIKELQYRKVLHSPPLRPRYMELAQTDERLERLRNGVSVFELI